MKLVRIDHMRCGETAASTYVWGKDDLTEEKFEADVETARVAYTASMTAAAEFAGPKPPGDYNMARPEIKVGDDDSLTVGELRSRAAKSKEEWAAWNERRRAASRPFAAYLADLGYTTFFDIEPDLATDISWGHAHGTTIDYEDTRPDLRDLAGAARKRTVSKRSGRVTSVSREDYVVTDPTKPAPADDEDGF